ncbi:MAG: DUF2071 domain-containing protein, partial [Candidatus Dadabacteria bacterium]|nr:DUF2071 domain-containing protein [Candidatus Dadabacteria bacterium]
LAMVNYIVDPQLLIPYTPEGTELDQYNGNYFISLVGFRFLNTKIKGFSIPFHTDFEEINLRFYVKRKSEDGWRRGVVFIKEIVPKTMIALVANSLYNENYICLKTDSEIDFVDRMPRDVKYLWKLNDVWNYISMSLNSERKELKAGSEEEFIAEHYWGYSKGYRNTTEYRVEHPKWCYWDTEGIDINLDIENLYGAKFLETLSSKPHSAFLAEGSEVTVSHGVGI